MPFDFEHAVGTPFRMQPGLRRLATGAAQLTPARPGSAHQREKLAVLSAFAGDALVQRDGFDPAPALHALCRHAAVEHPRSWQWDGRLALACGLGVGVDAVTGSAAQHAPGTFGLGDEVLRCLSSLAPAQRLTALLCLAFEEDFALVDAAPGPGFGTVPWLAVALPSHWAPEQKVGLHFAAVHAPVADSTLLLRASESLVRLVAGAERWERFVWNVTGHPRLHAHPDRADPQRWQHTPVERAWFRSERQTFLPLPALRQVVFTIQVEVAPLAAVLDTPARAAALHAAVASMSPAVLEYRSLTPVRDALLAWLAGRAAGLPSAAATPA